MTALVQDRTPVLVTGAARGIGLSVARTFLRQGRPVVLNDVVGDAVTDAARRLGDGAEPYVADIAQEAEVARMFADVAARLGPVTVLVNNAVRHGRQWIGETTVDDFDQMLRVNVLGVYLCARAAMDQMAHGPGGSIVNLSSVAAQRAFRGAVGYAATKGAVEAATRALALEGALYGVRVNAVAPGMVRTEAWDRLDEEQVRHRRSLIPLGREATPDDVAAAVAFLASPGAASITGHVLPVDGGMSVQAYAPPAEIPHLAGTPPPSPLGGPQPRPHTV